MLTDEPIHLVILTRSLFLGSMEIHCCTGPFCPVSPAAFELTSSQQCILKALEPSLMLQPLRNSSETSKGKCEVNLQLWMSNKRSLSPWTYSLNHDPARIPVDLPEARCLCLGCINPFTMQEDRTMVSVPIYSQIPVRRHLCSLFPRAGWRKQKACTPRTVMETIAVGCTCIF
uniref:Interleukin 17B n=1 Tax=Monodelphis domestica TaxID=13616 RepID=F6WY30_MONDO